MAYQNKLEFYSFFIHERNKPETLLQLDNFAGKNDFIKFFPLFAKSLDKDFFVNEKQKKSLEVKNKTVRIDSKSRTISGILESGDYGVESRIVDRTTKKTKYNRKKDDLDVKPFYFLLYIPEKTNIGLLILQRLGIYGINSIFTDHFQNYFTDKYQNLILKFQPYVSKDLAKKFVEGGAIKEFTLSRFNVPQDIIDKLGVNLKKEEVFSFKFIITAKKDSYLKLTPRVKKFVKNPDTKIFNIKELDTLGFDGKHNNTIKVQIGKDTRTVDLNDTMNIRPYFNIEDSIQIAANGHPTFDSIDQVAKEYLNNYIEEAES